MDISDEMIYTALQRLLDYRSHPILIHCNQVLLCMFLLFCGVELPLFTELVRLQSSFPCPLRSGFVICVYFVV